MNSGLFTVLLAVLFTFGGIGIYSYFQYSIVKKQDVLEKKLFFKNFTFASLGWLSLIIGLILFCVSYFISDETIDYFTKNDIAFDGAHGTMTYFGIILFSLFLYILTTSLIYILYIKRLENTKARKYLKWIMWISIPLVILFLLLFEEGIAPFLQYPLANQILFSSNGVELIYSVGKYQTEGFSLSIAFYAIFIILGACLVLYICDYQIYKKYGDHGLITACFFIAFPCGIIGARAWYVIGDWYRFADNPISMFYIWDGGLAIMGGAIFGVIAGVTFMIIRKIYNPRFKKIDYFLLIDFIVPTILVAQAIGRIGNFFNTEVHGEAVSISAWSFLPTFIKNNMHYSSSAPDLGPDQIYVPLFLVEAIVNLVGYFVIEFGIRHLFGINKLLKHDYHANGSCVGWYIAWYGATRAILEPMRYSAYNMGDDGNWSIISAYWMIGIGLFIVLIFIVLKVLKEKGIIKLQWDKYNEENTHSEEIKQ